ncbi:MAG: FliM/FliN family flagellar motor switch protein, partial [Thermicanus sp.]|nr:FliM/FliN family flagellar motor switch protein [Thermicanus sp.]
TTKIADISGMINLCLPHVVLEPLMPKLTAHYWLEEKQKKPDPAQTEQITQKIRQAELLIRVLLGSTTITIGDFIHLTKGDVIHLDQGIDDALPILLGEKKKFLGRPGIYNGRLAVRIDEIVKEGEEEDGE